MEVLNRSPRLELSKSYIDTRFAELSLGLGRMATTPEALLPRRIEGYLGRKLHLYGANVEGLSFAERNRRIDMITDIGLPVDNIRSLAHRKSYETGMARSEGWSTLATWDQQNGEFTTYDALSELPDAAKLATTVHELSHGMTALRQENAFLYGSEEKREAAAKFAVAVGRQSLETNTYINAYQKKLAEQFRNGEIDEFRFFEETSAILIEFSLTDRNKLRQIQEVQHAKIDRIAEQTGVQIEKIDLISAPDSDEALGADRVLVDLLDGVTTVRGIEAHVLSLKTKYASAEDGSKAATRAHKGCTCHAA